MNKPIGRHRAQKLTVRQIETLTKAGKYLDGEGLQLQVYNANSKTWIVRCTIKGQKDKRGNPLRKEYGLGSYKQVSLAQARDRAREYVRCARDGQDPTTVLRPNYDIPTFEKVASKYMTMRLRLAPGEGGWRSDKTRKQWQSLFERYVYPEIGTRPIDQITAPEIVNFLRPLWNEKRETARRVKQRIGLVFQYARGEGMTTAQNPILDVVASLPKKKIRPKHFTALDYHELPEFMRWLRDVETPAMSRLALEFTILTVARTGEIIGAKWNEIDLKKALWAIPAERMKAGKQHRVPLSNRCLHILKTLKPMTGNSGWVFESQSPGRPLSNMAMLSLLKRHDKKFTVHGFRSSFRDWVGEQTGFPHAAIEKCLAHEPASKVESAYARGELLDKRREIMNAWQAYALSEIGDNQNVVSMLAGR